MKLSKELLKVLLILMAGFTAVGAGLHYFLPLSTLTEDGQQLLLQPEEIIAIFPCANDHTFFVEFRDSTVATAEDFDSFSRRARFNMRDYSSLIRTEKNESSAPESQPGESPSCNRIVKGYDVFRVKGFVYINPNYFIVIDDKIDFTDCPCDDPEVIRDRDPNCPHIHHRTKQAILKRARECGLRDWFPVEKCDPLH